MYSLLFYTGILIYQTTTDTANQEHNITFVWFEARVLNFSGILFIPFLAMGDYSSPEMLISIFNKQTFQIIISQGSVNRFC